MCCREYDEFSEAKPFHKYDEKHKKYDSLDGPINPCIISPEKEADSDLPRVESFGYGRYEKCQVQRNKGKIFLDNIILIYGINNERQVYVLNKVRTDFTF